MVDGADDPTQERLARAQGALDEHDPEAIARQAKPLIGKARREAREQALKRARRRFEARRPAEPEPRPVEPHAVSRRSAG